MDELENHRLELTSFCNRLLGPADGEDAVQETFIRAVRSFDQLESRATLRPWLYAIARNVCLDMLEARKRRAIPIDLGAAPEPLLRAASPDPAPRIRLVSEGDPAEVAETRETVRLAIVTALRHLPPKQRAVLILCEVLRWKASEAAELLETSVASVTSALQRARATLAAKDLRAGRPSSVRAVDSELLAGYARAFESYDLEALTELIHSDGSGRRREPSPAADALVPITVRRRAGSATPRAARRRR